jgi:hypothetical protein
MILVVWRLKYYSGYEGNKEGGKQIHTLKTNILTILVLPNMLVYEVGIIWYLKCILDLVGIW